MSSISSLITETAQKRKQLWRDYQQQKQIAARDLWKKYREDVRALEDEMANKRLDICEARRQQAEAKRTALQKVEEAVAAAAALGVQVKVEVPERQRVHPDRPLSHWQLLMKRVGGILSANSLELIPGNRDIRILAVFCKFLLEANWFSYIIPDERILSAAQIVIATQSSPEDIRTRWASALNEHFRR
jgi:hypothetical protein